MLTKEDVYINDRVISPDKNGYFKYEGTLSNPNQYNEFVIKSKNNKILSKRKIFFRLKSDQPYIYLTSPQDNQTVGNKVRVAGKVYNSNTIFKVN